jgi:hypothetical protein
LWRPRPSAGDARRVAAFHAVAAPDAFEGGKRMDGDTLMQMLVDAHAAGRRFEWTVTEPSVRIDCNLATTTAPGACASSTRRACRRSDGPAQVPHAAPLACGSVAACRCHVPQVQARLTAGG